MEKYFILHSLNAMYSPLGECKASEPTRRRKNWEKLSAL
jgi:hypothetical protein